jgi:hypothetical protein
MDQNLIHYLQLLNFAPNVLYEQYGLHFPWKPLGNDTQVGQSHSLLDKDLILLVLLWAFQLLSLSFIQSTFPEAPPGLKHHVHPVHVHSDEQHQDREDSTYPTITQQP